MGDKILGRFLFRKRQYLFKGFQNDFYTWLWGNYVCCRVFQHWLRQYLRRIFTIFIATHREYLWKEATNVKFRITAAQNMVRVRLSPINHDIISISTNLKSILFSKRSRQSLFTATFENCISLKFSGSSTQRRQPLQKRMKQMLRIRLFLFDF